MLAHLILDFLPHYCLTTCSLAIWITCPGTTHPALRDALPSCGLFWVAHLATHLKDAAINTLTDDGHLP